MPTPNDLIPVNNDAPSDLVPVNQETNQQPQQTSLGSNLMAMGLGGAAAVGAGYGAQQGWKSISPQRTKMSGDLINSIIKPRHREFMFGKNPGQGIAQEGIWGVSLDSIGKGVDKRLGELNTYAKSVRSLPENQGKTVSLEKVLDPFYEALDELGKAPETHQTKINEIYGMVKDLEGNIPKGLNIKEVPIETAYGIKKVVEQMQKWNVESSGDRILNSALKKVYHNVDASIDTTLPELRSINSRMANLISAKKAIASRSEILSKHEFNIGDIANLPLKVGTSTVSKSLLARVLSEKFGMVAKKGVSGMLAVTPFLDAIRYAQDPQAYMYQMETGGTLQPKGSLERKIQTGEVI